MIIDDSDYAISILKRTSYFAIICGYKHLFKNKTTKKYKDGTKFEDIVELYRFDQKLRELFLSILLKIERHMKSLLSYYFTEAHGESQDEYLNPDNYENNQKNKPNIEKFINKLNEIMQPPNGGQCNYDYVQHHIKKYKNVPLWVIINTLTFGNISKMYSFSKPSLQAKISKEFVELRENDIGDILNVLSKFRNVCAHNERLFNYKTTKAIPDLSVHIKLKIPKVGNFYKYGKNDLFSVVICFKYLLPNDDFLEFFGNLNKILGDYLSKSRVLSKNVLLEEMGFPQNWEDILKVKIV